MNGGTHPSRSPAATLDEDRTIHQVVIDHLVESGGVSQLDFKEVARRSGVNSGRLRRRFRTAHQLTQMCVDSVIRDAMPLAWQTWACSGDVADVARDIVAKRIALYHAIRDVLPSVLTGHTDSALYDALVHVLRAELRRWLDTLVEACSDAEVEALTNAVDEALGLHWIYSLYEVQQRAHEDILEVLTDNVETLFARHGVGPHRRPPRLVVLEGSRRNEAPAIVRRQSF